MYKLPVCILSFLALSSANPVFHYTSNIKDTLNSIINQHTAQLPLTSPKTTTPDSSSASTSTLEIEAWNIFGIPAYITPIAVGNPPQVFRAFLDLSFGGLLVRALDCGSDSGQGCGYGGDLGFMFNSSASTTYKDGDESFHFMLPAHNIYGEVGRDGVELVNLGLENVTMGVVDDFYGENYFFLVMADIADGALGLAPPNVTATLPYSKHPAPNILSHLLTQAPLASPLLTFSLPDTYNGELGAITLGALPPGQDEVELSIPFGDPKEGWNIPLSGLTLEAQDNDTKIEDDFTIDLKDFTLYPAFLPGLIFPPNLTETLYEHLHALPDSGWIDGREFNCSYRNHLPDISFQFPSSTCHSSKTTTLSFTEADYTLHGDFGEDEICFLMITPAEEGPPGEDIEKAVNVGMPLWEKWHVVFDLAEGEAGSMGLIAREGEDGEGMVKTREARGRVDFAKMRKRAEFDPDREVTV